MTWGLEPCSRAREACGQGCQVRANGAIHASHNRERDALCMVRHERERVLRRVVRAVDAAARNFAREAAQLENSYGREACCASAVSGALTSEKPIGSLLIANPVSRELAESSHGNVRKSHIH